MLGKDRSLGGCACVVHEWGFDKWRRLTHFFRTCERNFWYFELFQNKTSTFRSPWSRFLNIGSCPSFIAPWCSFISRSIRHLTSEEVCHHSVLMPGLRLTLPTPPDHAPPPSRLEPVFTLPETVHQGLAWPSLEPSSLPETGLCCCSLNKTTPRQAPAPAIS